MSRSMITEIDHRRLAGMTGLSQRAVVTVIAIDHKIREPFVYNVNAMLASSEKYTYR